MAGKAGSRGWGHIRKLPSGRFQASYIHELVRLTAEQRAEIRARVATWPPLTEAQRAQVAALFAPYVSKLGSS